MILLLFTFLQMLVTFLSCCEATVMEALVEKAGSAVVLLHKLHF